MAWTQTQVDALRDAIATGTLRVKVGDMDTQFRSQADMLQLLRVMEAEVSATARVLTIPAIIDRGP